MSASRVLVACPTYRLEPETVTALLAIRRRAQADGQPLDLLLGTDNPHPVAPDAGAKNMLHQLRRVRRVFLAEGYDRLLMIESDIIPPDDALARLTAVVDEGADVAYGMYSFRRRDGVGASSALNLLRRAVDEPGGCRNVGAPMRPEDPSYRRAWRTSGVLPVSGAGLGVVLMRRRVVEAVPFRWEGVAHPDHYFTRDVWRKGFDQRAHVRVRCGHKTPGGQVLWPPRPEGIATEGVATEA